MAKDDDWAQVHGPEGTLTRNAYGQKLTVTPVNPKRPKGASIWTVRSGGWGVLQGEVPSQRGAKTAAMHVAKRQMAADEKPKAGKTKAPKSKPAKPAKPAKAAKPAKPVKAAKPAKPVKAAKPAKPAKAKTSRAPRKGSARQHVEDLRQRTARLLAEMAARSS